jgi:3-hydroxyacyl-CoA dehydrogenase
MPSEYIMYLSILLVGTLAIGGISVTMISINSSMEDRAIETGMENLLQNISETILGLMESEQKKIAQGATVIHTELNLADLPKQIQEEEYKIVVIFNNLTYSLKASLIDNADISVTVSLFISPGSISISGVIESTGQNPRVTFTYDGVTSNIILED